MSACTTSAQRKSPPPRAAGVVPPRDAVRLVWRRRESRRRTNPLLALRALLRSGVLANVVGTLCESVPRVRRTVCPPVERPERVAHPPLRGPRNFKHVDACRGREPPSTCRRRHSRAADVVLALPPGAWNSTSQENCGLRDHVFLKPRPDQKPRRVLCFVFCVLCFVFCVLCFEFLWALLVSAPTNLHVSVSIPSRQKVPFANAELSSV